MTNKRFKQDRRSFQDQLGNLSGGHQRIMSTNNVSSRRLPAISALPPCGTWLGDGIDHINIDSRSKVELGIALTLKFHLPFTHDVFGKFKTFSDLWQAIDDYMGSHAIYSQSVNLPLIMADGLWQRVKQYPKLEEELRESVLPFDMYSFGATDLPSRRPISYWWLEAVERVRQAVKDGAEAPDFSPLIRNGRNLEEELRHFVEVYIPNRRNAAAKVEVKENLVRELRKSVPVKLNTTRKFSMSLKPSQGAREKDVTKETSELNIERLRNHPSLDAEKVAELFTEAPTDLDEASTTEVTTVEKTEVVEEVKVDPIPVEAPQPVPVAEMTIEQMFATGQTGEVDISAMINTTTASEVEVVEVVEIEVEEIPLCSDETDLEIQKVINCTLTPEEVVSKITALLLADEVFTNQLTPETSFSQMLEGDKYTYTVQVYEGIPSLSFEQVK